MHRTYQIFAVALLLIGAALVVRALVDGVWPLSVQFVAGCLLVLTGALRLRYF